MWFELYFLFLFKTWHFSTSWICGWYSSVLLDILSHHLFNIEHVSPSPAFHLGGSTCTLYIFTLYLMSNNFFLFSILFSFYFPLSFLSTFHSAYFIFWVVCQITLWVLNFSYCYSSFWIFYLLFSSYPMFLPKFPKKYFLPWKFKLACVLSHFSHIHSLLFYGL